MQIALFTTKLGRYIFKACININASADDTNKDYFNHCRDIERILEKGSSNYPGQARLPV